MELKEAIFGRRSIRNYEDLPVENEKIQLLIEAATYAPSACNFQAWKYIVIDDEQVLDDIVKIGGNPIIKRAKVGIMVLYRNDLMVDGRKHYDYIQSAAASIQNMLLRAYDLGLATCWICNIPTNDELRPILHFPKNYDVIAYVTVGYPKSGNESNTNEMVYHYSTVDNYKNHKRRFSYDQVVCRNTFKSVEGDSTVYTYHRDGIKQRIYYNNKLLRLVRILKMKLKRNN